MNKKWWWIWLCSLGYAVGSLAQSETKFADNLWYGGGFNLGINGGTGQSAFGIGLSPMVGYKLGGPFSIGPRVAVNYTHFRVRLPNNQVAKANPVSWAAGVFGRIKFMRQIFAHVEYELAEDAFIGNITTANGIEIFRRQTGNTYIGLGYNSGGVFASDITLLYNVTPPPNELAPPFALRFGFTYKF